MSTRIQELEQLIQYHDHQFWKLNNPIITDEEYDKLVQELKSLQPDHPLVNKVHGQRINSQGKVIHLIPMLSLDKVYNNVDLFKWLDKTSRNATFNGGDEVYMLEPKLDGLSSDFTDGILSTRGDGEFGEDISSKIPIITVESKDYNGPLINCPSNKRGEIIVKQNTYEKYKDVIIKWDGTPYKTARGMASGLLNQDDVDLSLTAVLTFVEFDNFALYYTDPQLRELDWSDLHKRMKEWDYPTDGLVIKLADKKYSLSLGSTSHHPRGQIAYKAANPSAKSVLRKVIWQSGKGKLTPVGVIDPVVIAGATIERVSMHNAKNIIDRDIKINDELTIERAGEIIPYVVGVAPGTNRIPISIDSCPDCNTTVIYSEPDIKCPNNNCYGMLAKTLTDSVARLGFEYLAGATVQKLIDIGIESLIDILNVTLNDIYQLEGFAETSSHKLYDEVQRIKTQPLEDWKFVSALNIKGIGRRVSRKILSHMTLAELKVATVDQLVLIDSIGIERAIEISEYFEKNQMFVNELEGLLNVIHEDESKPETLVCFTGKVDRPRGELNKIAESKGLTPTNTVSKKLAMLVTNDLNGTKGKMQKARKLGTKIITYEQFYGL